LGAEYSIEHTEPVTRIIDSPKRENAMFLLLAKYLFLLPVIVSVIQDVETALAARTGPEKKVAVLDAINQAISLLPIPTADIPLITAGASSLIDVIVSAYNLFGFFHHKNAPAAA
jgi:hypothetical protein